MVVHTTQMRCNETLKSLTACSIHDMGVGATAGDHLEYVIGCKQNVSLHVDVTCTCTKSMLHKRNHVYKYRHAR